MAPAVSYDDHNQPIKTWQKVAEAWASWRRATANERLASGQVSAQVTDVFEVLWTEVLEQVDARHELEFKGLRYDIVEATEIGYREGVTIRASAKADGKP